MVGNGNQLPQPDILKGGYGPVQEAVGYLVGMKGITEIHQKDACVSVQVVPFFLPADVVEIRGNNEQLISQMTESPVSILEGKHFFRVSLSQMQWTRACCLLQADGALRARDTACSICSSETGPLK